MNFTVPEGIERVTLMIRHSVAPKTGTDGNKTLTVDGVLLCHEAKPFYQNLVEQISQDMSAEAAFFCSTFPRSMMTAWEIFHAANIQPEESLKVLASLLSINNGEWAKAQMAAGKNEPAMIREFLGNKRELFTEDFGHYHCNYAAFVAGNAGSTEAKRAKFAVAVCHEAGISLAAEHFLPLEQLGLANCEAVLFYVAGGAIIGAEKIVPQKQAIS